MNNYIELVKDILENGVDTDSRAGKCRMLTHKTLSYELSEGFPRLTHRSVPFKSVMVELEGFLGGITSKSWFEERKCKFWREWSNPEVVNNRFTQSKEKGQVSCFPESVELQKATEDLYRSMLQTDIDDLGPVYGYQQRRFNRPYRNEFPVTNKLIPMSGQPGDQIQTVLDTLLTNPEDRRMYVSSWNPLQVSQMALRPCHISWKVDKIGDQLDLRFTMASSDIYLGLPANIQYYAVLLHLLAKHGNLKPGKLTATLDNVHLYHNLLPQAEELITRDSHPLPTLEFEEYGDFWDWSHDKVKCVGYKHSGSLKALVSV